MIIIIFIFIYIDCTIATTTCSQNIFEMTTGKKMTNSQNTITKPMSKEDCVALCAKDSSCAAASFNKNSHICEMHDQIYSAMDNSPSVLFSRMNGKFLIKWLYSFWTHYVKYYDICIYIVLIREKRRHFLYIDQKELKKTLHFCSLLSHNHFLVTETGKTIFNGIKSTK